MTYNLTGIAQNTTGLLEFSQHVNEQLTYGWLFTLILFAIYVILIIAFMQTMGDIKKGIAAASWICFIFSVFLRGLGLIPNIILFAGLTIAALSLAFIWRE